MNLDLFKLLSLMKPHYILIKDHYNEILNQYNYF